MKKTRVFSSTVDWIAHDPNTLDLHIGWVNGKQSVYENVPSHVAVRLPKEYSVGKAINDYIKPHYSHRYHE